MHATVCLAIAATVGALLMGEAAATPCQGAHPAPVAATTAMQPFADRFNALQASDPYQLNESQAGQWRALIGDLKRTPDASAELMARSEMALSTSLQSDAHVAESLAIAQSALARAEAANIHGSLHGALLTELAAKEAAAGKAMDAVTHADAALVETEHSDGSDSWAYGNAALNAATAHNASGDYIGTERFAAIGERLAAVCLPPGTSIIGATIGSHAATLGTLGRTEEALVEDERAITWDVAHLPESDLVVANALADLAWTLRNANRLREAEALLRRATGLFARYHPEDYAERALSTGKFANVLAAEGKYREAEPLWLAAQEFYAQAHDLSNPLAGSGELRRGADAAQAQGKLAEALDLRRRAVALIASRVQPRHPELARARIEYAATLAITGHASEALALARPAVAIMRETASVDDFKRMGAEIAYALIASEAGEDPAKTYAEASPVAARMAAVLLDSATSRGDLIRFAPIFATSFAAVARLAIAAHDDDAAFRALQLANLSEVALVRNDVAVRAAAGDPRVRALIEHLATLRRDHQRLDHDRITAHAQGDAAKEMAIDAGIKRSDDDVAQTTQALDRIFPGYRLLSRPRPVALAAFRARLSANEVLLAPLTLPGATLVVAVTRDQGLRSAKVAAAQARVIDLVARIRGSIDAARFDPHARFDAEAARALGEIVLPPALASVVSAHSHLVYYASGALATVPPALLITAPLRANTPPAWLVRSHAISIATALDMHPGVHQPVHDSFLGVGAPSLGGKPLAVAMRGVAMQVGDFGKAGVAALPPLPHAEAELRRMSAMFPPGKRHLLTGARATKAAFEGLPLDRYGVIAMATHGLVADALPGLTQPALVLTPSQGPGAADDGLLTAGEIAGLHLDADWVILSACDTASGSDPQSGSYNGLASAFIQAGARALLVSHWPVRDDAAGRITLATLAAGRRGLDRPAALQQAMLALMRNPTLAGAANPAIWAPFVLVDR